MFFQDMMQLPNNEVLFGGCLFQHPASAFLYHSWAFTTFFKIPVILDSSGEADWTSNDNPE